jgi:hypothetical protein
MVRIQIRPQGARVSIRKGYFPIDPSFVGKTGTVVHRLKDSSSKDGVQLDGEVLIRVVTEDALEARV